MAVARPNAAMPRALVGVLCGLVLPAALIAWAAATADLVRIPAVHSLWFGLALLLAGATIALAPSPPFPSPGLYRILHRLRGRFDCGRLRQRIVAGFAIVMLS